MSFLTREIIFQNNFKTIFPREKKGLKKTTRRQCHCLRVVFFNPFFSSFLFFHVKGINISFLALFSGGFT